MKQLLILLISVSLCLQAPMAFAQEATSSVQLSQGKPVRIRYKSLNFKGPVKTVLLRDKNTGKRAMLALPLIDAKNGIYEGTFVVLFDPSQESSDVEVDVSALEVHAVAVKKPRTLSKTNLSKQNLILLQTRQQEQQRQKFEMSEAQRRAQMEAQARALSEQERAARKAKALNMAAAAMKAYESKRYAEASRLFKDAISFDPENNKYYYQYGVSLFQQKEYQRSLVALSMAEEGDFSRVDKNYFTGMNYFRLKDNDKALKSFLEVREEEDPNLSPTASFYAGVLQFNATKYPDAKTSFNYVLDKSQDPAMDRSAESYLEKIDAIEQFDAKFKEKWAYSLYAGLMYDSNILNVADANAPTDIAGFRAMYGGSLERRFIYSYFTEWSAVATIGDMYSTNTSLETKQELQNADPLVMGLKSPIKFKTNLFKRPYSLLLTPGFETINLNADATGPRENVTNSYYLSADNSFVHTDRWIGSYSLEVRSDISSIPGLEVDDQTALKTSLGTTQIFVGDVKKSQSYVVDTFVINNNAQGDNQKYNRVNLGLSYTQAFYWQSQAALRLDLGIADYNDSLTGRKDNNYGLSLSAGKALGAAWSTSLSLGFSQNNSNVDAYAYKKISLSNIYTYSGAF